MAGGRPSKYKPEYCDLLMAHMKEGLSFDAFGAKVNASRETLYTWTEKHPEFLDTKKRGESIARGMYEKIGTGLALGQVSGNVTAWIFIMKNRFGWRDRQEIEHVGKDGGPIEYSNLNEEDLRARAAKIAERLKGSS